MRVFVLFCVFLCSALSAQREDLGNAASLTVYIFAHAPDRIAVGETSHPLSSAQDWLRTKIVDLEAEDSIVILCDPSISIGTIIQAENLVRAIHPRVFVVCRNADASNPYTLLTTESYATDIVVRQLMSSEPLYIEEEQPQFIYPPGLGLFVEPPQDLIDRLQSQE